MPNIYIKGKNEDFYMGLVKNKVENLKIPGGIMIKIDSKSRLEESNKKKSIFLGKLLWSVSMSGNKIGLFLELCG